MATLVLRRPSLLDEFERMVGLVPLDGGLSMTMDVFEEKDELVVRAELTGVGKDKIDITIDKDSLRIEAEKAQEEKTDDGEQGEAHYSVSETSMAFTLPLASSSKRRASIWTNIKAPPTGTAR